jgi:signal transduction histidine kinase
MIHSNTAPSERRLPNRGTSRSANELLPRVLGVLPVGVALFELEADGFRFRYGNQLFARVLTLDRMPEEGQLVGDVFNRAEHDAVIELFRLVRVSREPQSYFTAEGGQGPTTSRILNIDAYPLLKLGRVSHVLVLAEQTQEKLEARHRQELEANRLRKKADHLASLEQAKSEFLRLASHELRGPAATLGGYLAMIEDESLGPIPQRLRPVLPMLRAKASQINLLANEMVEAARLEDGGVQLKRKRVDLRELVRRSVSTAETTATPSHRVRFDDRIGGELWVLGDVLRLEIIVANLLDNAVKYSPKGGDVTAQLTMSGDRAVLKVQDHGIGIAPEDMDRLFVRFSRVPTLIDVPGTGLGLYLARELARLHKGEIVAASKPGEGSEFVLSLPVEPHNK